MKIVLALIMTAVAGSIMIGCGGKDDEGPVTDNGEMVVDIELEIAGGEFYYEPDEIAVESGSEVRIIFVNEGEMPHDLIIDDVGGTEIIGAGESDSFVFTAPEKEDVMVFYSSIGQHREQGMEGTIEITKQ